MNKTGGIITELRKEAGYTQKSLAEALNITDKAVSKWERGICLPDVALLPKLSLLLDADIELLLSKDSEHLRKSWTGLIDLREFSVDLSWKVYDKPMVYYMLSHFLLLDITEICFLTDERNREYLSSGSFIELGFHFSFDFPSVEKNNLMIMNRPSFVFGSDLTRKFNGAMVSESLIKLIPDNLPPQFLFCPEEYAFMYAKNPEYLYETASSRTLGRGMVCIEMNSTEKIFEAAMFVKTYQQNAGLPIACLEEIAFRKGIISKEHLILLAEKTDYRNFLKELSK